MAWQSKAVQTRAVQPDWGGPLEQGEEELPCYQDPQYGCEMEILRFHFWDPNPRIDRGLKKLKASSPKSV